MTIKLQELGPIQEQWLRDLESGAYKQGIGMLENNGKYCCLGVFAYTQGGKPRKNDTGYAHLDDIDTYKLGLHSRRGQCKGGKHSLTYMNDAGKTFAEIAQFIRRNPKKVFKEVR